MFNNNFKRINYNIENCVLFDKRTDKKIETFNAREIEREILITSFIVGGLANLDQTYNIACHLKTKPIPHNHKILIDDKSYIITQVLVSRVKTLAGKPLLKNKISEYALILQ